MSDPIDKLLHMAMAGPFADFAPPADAEPLEESDQLTEDDLTPEERMLLGLDRGSAAGPWFGDDEPTGHRPLMEGDTSHYFPKPMALAEHRSDSLPLVEEALDCEPFQTVSFSAGPWAASPPQAAKPAAEELVEESWQTAPLVERAKTAQAVIGQSWAFKKKGSARKFKDLLDTKSKREGGDWYSQISKTSTKVAVSSQGPMDQSLLNALNKLASAHHGRPVKTVYEDENLSEMELGDIDGHLKNIRAKVIKGAKPTRNRRLAGCLRSLRTGGIAVSGQSQTDLNPVPKVERNKEDQPKDDTPGEVDEGMTGPDSYKYTGAQPKKEKCPPRTKWDHRRGRCVGTRRHEDTEDVMKLSDAIRRFRGESTEKKPEPKTESKPAPKAPKVEARVQHGETFDDLRDKGMALDDFGSFDNREDVDFAEAMMRDDPALTGMDRRLAQLEANIPAKGGKSKSKFRAPYKGPKEGVHGAVSVPADPEAKAAAARSTAGVKGPGYGPDGREEVDVRTEDHEPATADELDDFAAGMEYPTDLVH